MAFSGTFGPHHDSPGMAVALQRLCSLPGTIDVQLVACANASGKRDLLSRPVNRLSKATTFKVVRLFDCLASGSFSEPFVSYPE